MRIANYLCNGNYAVSGGIEGIEVRDGERGGEGMRTTALGLHPCLPPPPQAGERLAKSFKARMAVRLAVAGAFHTDFMQARACYCVCVCVCWGGGGRATLSCCHPSLARVAALAVGAAV